MYRIVQLKPDDSGATQRYLRAHGIRSEEEAIEQLKQFTGDNGINGERFIQEYYDGRKRGAYTQGVIVALPEATKKQIVDELDETKKQLADQAIELQNQVSSFCPRSSEVSLEDSTVAQDLLESSEIPKDDQPTKESSPDDVCAARQALAERKAKLEGKLEEIRKKLTQKKDRLREQQQRVIAKEQEVEKLAAAHRRSIERDQAFNEQRMKRLQRYQELLAARANDQRDEFRSKVTDFREHTTEYSRQERASRAKRRNRFQRYKKRVRQLLAEETSRALMLEQELAEQRESDAAEATRQAATAPRRAIAPIVIAVGFCISAAIMAVVSWQISDHMIKPVWRATMVLTAADQKNDLSLDDGVLNDAIEMLGQRGIRFFSDAGAMKQFLDQHLKTTVEADRIKLRCDFNDREGVRFILDAIGQSFVSRTPGAAISQSATRDPKPAVDDRLKIAGFGWIASMVVLLMGFGMLRFWFRWPSPSG